MDPVPFARIRKALRHTGFGGVAVSKSNLTSLYACAASSCGFHENGSSEWAVVSYVRTNSPSDGVGGIPTYVITEVEDVLDGLLDAGVLDRRALWFDALSAGRTGAAAARMMHCIGAPVICVPPTRIKEYARFQKPDRWDSKTFTTLVEFETMLKNCSTCGRQCPDQWDTRLINVAAVLRTWPITDAMLGAVGRGAFVSFESFDRFSYTIEWYLVLLHLALECGEYSASLIGKSVELYGQALFRPCASCVCFAKNIYRRVNGIHLKHIEDCIAQLVAHASRLTLTHSEDRVTRNLWTLPGLQRTAGENVLWRFTSNEARLEILSRRSGPSVVDLRVIAAGMLRGRPSEGSCQSHSEKWTAAAVLANPEEMCGALLSARDGVLSKRAYAQILQEVLRIASPSYGAFLVDPELRKCKRAPKCTGNGQLCLFCDFSGVVPPSAAVSFLHDCFLTRKEVARAARLYLSNIICVVSYARVCYLAAWRVAAGKEVCCACHPQRRAFNESRRLALVGWDPLRHCSLTQEPRLSSRAPLRNGQVFRPFPFRTREVLNSDGRYERNTLDVYSSVKKRCVEDEAGKRIGVTCSLAPCDEIKSQNGGSFFANSKTDTMNHSDKPLKFDRVSKMSNLAPGQKPMNHTSECAESRGTVVTERSNVHDGGAREVVRTSLRSPLLTYVVVDAGKMEHVVASGVESMIRGAPTTGVCSVCSGTFVSMDLEHADETLEVHLDQEICPKQASLRLQNGMAKAHDLYSTD